MKKVKITEEQYKLVKNFYEEPKKGTYEITIKLDCYLMNNIEPKFYVEHVDEYGSDDGLTIQIDNETGSIDTLKNFGIINIKKIK